jgi:hypothetical protein
MAILKLLDNVAVDTVGTAFRGDGGGKALSVIGNSLGGGSVTVEVSDESKTYWAPVTFKDGIPFVVTVFAVYKLEKMPQGQYIRASLSGSSGANDVSVILSM